MASDNGMMGLLLLQLRKEAPKTLDRDCLGTILGRAMSSNFSVQVLIGRVQFFVRALQSRLIDDICLKVRTMSRRIYYDVSNVNLVSMKMTRRKKLIVYAAENANVAAMASI